MGTAKITFKENGEMKVDYDGYQGTTCNNAEKKLIKVLALKLKLKIQKPKKDAQLLKEKEHA